MEPEPDDEAERRAAALLARAPVPPLPAAQLALARELARAAGAGELLPAGATLGGYTIRSLLGRGGQAAVYLAVDGRGREVALKTPRREVLAGLVREAQILFHLDHPRVVRIEEAAVTADPPFLVTEHLPAGSLAARLRRDGPLAWPDVLTLGADVLEALAYAHGKGVVHRDLKPGNVLFDGAGRAKVADFGMGALSLLRGRGADHSLASQDLTLAGGTPLYMAPEQEDGDPAAVDGRADLYALGKLLYEAATGSPPRTLRPLTRTVRGACLAADDLVFRLCEERPADRFPSAEAALAALRELEEEARAEARRQVRLRAARGGPHRPSASERHALGELLEAARVEWQAELLLVLDVEGRALACSGGARVSRETAAALVAAGFAATAEVGHLLGDRLVQALDLRLDRRRIAVRRIDDRALLAALGPRAPVEEPALIALVAELGPRLAAARRGPGEGPGLEGILDDLFGDV